MSESKKIIKILRTLKPERKPFSKLSRKLNQSFQYSNIENLIKTLKKKYIYQDQFLQKLGTINQTNDYDINFQNSIKYINELSDIKSLPLVAANKNYIVNGKIDLDFEKEDIKKENNRKKKIFLKIDALRKKEKMKKSEEILKRYKENNKHLILSKYNPNYDYIKPRIFHAFILQPKIQINKPRLINNPLINTVKKIKSEKKEENKNISFINDDSKIIPENKFDKIKKNIDKMVIMPNISIFNDSNSISNINEKTESILTFKNPNFLNNKSPKKIKIKKIKALNISFPKINKIKCQINFGKMKSRNRLFKKSDSSIDYSPNYNFILPRTPSYSFKYIPNKENYKKYMNGKIIRGYKFDSDSYYVMKFKNNSVSM